MNHGYYIKDNNSLHNTITNIIIKKMTSPLSKNIYNSNIFANLFQFYNIIKSYSFKVPDYILEYLILNDFFITNNINKNKITFFFKKIFCNENISCHVKCIKEKLEIKIIKNNIHKFYIFENKYLSIKDRNNLLNNKKRINKFLNRNSIFYEKKEIHYTHLIDLVKKLISLTKGKLYIQRFKGLGEMNPEQLWDTTLNPKHRTLLKITTNDLNKADETFTNLMGEIVTLRRELIKKNSLKKLNIDY